MENSAKDKLRQQLQQLGLITARDFLLHVPLRYENHAHVHSVQQAKAVAAPVLLSLEVLSSQLNIKTPKRILQVLAHEVDSGQQVKIIFLHAYAALEEKMQAGSVWNFYGEVKVNEWGECVMMHPSYQKISALPEYYTPIYPSTAHMPQAYLRQAIFNQLAQYVQAHQQRTNEHGPAQAYHTYMQPHQLLQMIHQPPAANAPLQAWNEKTHPAFTSLAFYEILAQQLCLHRIDEAQKKHPAPELIHRPEIFAKLFKRLPFKLTAGQMQAYADIHQDLSSTKPMYRLLQGDVGSGKTIVAILALLQCVDAGFQAAYMAPTDILANQLYQKVSETLAPLASMGGRVALLTGRCTTKEKLDIKKRLLEHQIDVVIGTHALLQEDVIFAKMALMVIDEQHRFGVEQRLKMREKQQVHTLLMSATPIPRTLAMVDYGHIDISSIREMPKNRQPIQTLVLERHKRATLMTRLKKYLDKGEQIYWVCPRVSELEDEKISLQAAESLLLEVQNALPNINSAILHGKMPGKAKQATMDHFSQGQIKILVATTVIEVGIDVPQANIMIIENAQQFGLTQLHQLRGRVGRGSGKGICILLYDAPLSLMAHARLDAIKHHQDGFVIAQKDLELRGPGEVLGTRQSGDWELCFFDPRMHAQVLEDAQAMAHILIEKGNVAQMDRYIRFWLGRKARLPLA